MTKAKPCATSGQDVYATFQIELIDSQGVCQDRIGYRFTLASATAGAEAWNRQEQPELTAIVRPFDGESENVFDRKLREDQEATSQYVSDIEPDEYRVLVLMHSGSYFLLRDEFTLGQAEHWVATWSHKTAAALVVHSDDLGEHVSSLKYMKAPSSDSNALDEQDDSDAMEGTEDATGASTEGDFSDDDRYDLERDAKVVRGRFVREVFRNHWTQVERSIDLLADWGDVGIVSRSLEALAETMGGESNYASGTDGGWNHAELAESLGFEVATA